MQPLHTGIFTLLLQLLFVPHCFGHFLWVKTIDHQDQPHALLFFGENAVDEAYHLPDRLAHTNIWLRNETSRTKLTTQRLETAERIGLIAPLTAPLPYVLEATQQYGIYGNSLLHYHAKHIRANSANQLNSLAVSADLKLDLVPRLKKESLELTVMWNGKPLPTAELRYSVGNSEAVKAAADKHGRAVLQTEGEGIIAVLANHLDKEPTGQIEGKTYNGVLHFASLTLELAKTALPAGKERVTESKRTTSSQSTPNDSECMQTTDEPQAALPQLPEPVSSFGAAITGGWLYVYSGHTGNEHEHSAANLSKHFRRIRLDGTGDWEELPMQMPLQGLALVAHKEKVYRVGGMNARNATLDDEEELHSVDEFAEYDPATRQWRSLEPLPTPRSSHNAVVIGTRLYVIGGWRLSGQSPGEWQQTVLMYDFDDPQAGWQLLPDPPFFRRALAASHWKGRLVAIGGIDENGEASSGTELLDLQTGKWSSGPDLAKSGMAGFGASACNMDGRLYVSGVSGVVYRLNETGSAWEEAGRLKKGRFFHQLLPGGDGRLVAVGGASHDGHLSSIEWIEVNP